MAKAAIASGVARSPRDIDEYRERLEKRLIAAEPVTS